MKLYDSSLRSKVDFEPVVPGKVTMYVCGPTVYDNIHIGNARTFLSFDIIRRWLVERGYDVTFAQNLTDVDDKIIKRANERGVAADEVSTQYANAFIEVMERFGIQEPDIRPRATQEIPAMIEMIETLIAGAHAYEAQGDVYFHGGGADLQFSHHENECAQAQCAWGGKFANHWMHTGMLLVDGEKMSKSLGNFFTLKDVLDEYPADALRLLMAQTHYRSPLDFSFERLRGAAGSLERIANTVQNLAWAADHAPEGADTAAELAQTAEKARAEFEACMDDDFNTAGATGAVFGLVTAANTYLDQAQGCVDAQACRLAADVISWGMAVLGISLKGDGDEGLPTGLVDLAAKHGCAAADPDAAAQALLELRAQARREKNWPLADAIRNDLTDLGLVIEDTAQGARVKRA